MKSMELGEWKMKAWATISMIPNMIGILMLITDPEAATGSQGYIVLFHIMAEGTPLLTGISRDRRR